MKKLLFSAMAAGLCATVMAEITSANVVGYKTDALTDGNFNMVSVSFNNVDGTGVQLNGGNVTFENLITGFDFSDGPDLIEVWNPETSGYTYHYFYDQDGWTDDSGNGYFEDDYPDGLPAGAAFWYEAAENASAPTITFKKPF